MTELMFRLIWHDHIVGYMRYRKTGGKGIKPEFSTDLKIFTDEYIYHNDFEQGILKHDRWLFEGDYIIQVRPDPYDNIFTNSTRVKMESPTYSDVKSVIAITRSGEFIVDGPRWGFAIWNTGLDEWEVVGNIHEPDEELING